MPPGVYSRPSLADRLRARTLITDTCHVWQGSVDNDGYGRLFIRKGTCGPLRGIRVHRLAWLLANGPIPDRLAVLHHCDNPPCVRIEHLYVGTNSDNMRDRSDRKRGPEVFLAQRPNPKLQGERRPTARLTEQAVRNIRHRYAAGDVSQLALATEYGIGQTTISNVLRRKKWSHIS